MYFRIFLIQNTLGKFLLKYDPSVTGLRGTQREILRKRHKNNNKAWTQLSEAILSILGDCWEKFICSSLPARLMEEFPASTVHLQPATSLLASWGVVIGQNSFSGRGGGGRGGGQRGFWQTAHSSYIHSELSISKQHFPFKDILFFPNLPASKTLPK